MICLLAAAETYCIIPSVRYTTDIKELQPLFFVIFMVIALSFGPITSPMDVCLYAACNVSGMPIEKITKGSVPWLAVWVACLLIFILFPDLIAYPISLLFLV